MQHAIRLIGTAPGTIVAVNNGYAAVRVGDRIDLMSFGSDKPHVCCRIVEDIEGYNEYIVTILNGETQLTSVEIRHAHFAHRGRDTTELRRTSALITTLTTGYGSAAPTDEDVYFLAPRGFIYDLLCIDKRWLSVAEGRVELPPLAHSIDLQVSRFKYMIAYSLGENPEERRLLETEKAVINWRTHILHPHTVRKCSVFVTREGGEVVTSGAVKEYWMTKRYRRIGDRLAWVEGHGTQWRIRISTDRREREHLALPYIFDEVGELYRSDSQLTLWGSVGNELLEVTITP